VVQIAQGTEIPAKTLYGSSPGHLGEELQDLLKSKIVEMRYFSGERGRGGEVMRFRISDPKTIRQRKSSPDTNQEIVETSKRKSMNHQIRKNRSANKDTVILLQ
jgi:hypothetical protein